MKLKALTIIATTALLVGCPDDDDTVKTDSYTFEVTLENLTANQPLSPFAVLAHNDQFTLFSTGMAASIAVEQMAESGDNSAILAYKESDTNVMGAYSGNGVIMPGGSETISFTTTDKSVNRVSISSMLVNTNDAFVGFNQADLSALTVDGAMTYSLAVWDAGTEANSETAATIPGPAGGGEGFNSDRDDNDIVTLHSGVISADDGLSTSTLNASHRFQNPAARLTITRME